MAYRSNGRGSFIIEMRVKGIGNIRRASGAKTHKEYENRLDWLRNLREAGQYELLQKLHDGEVTVGELYGSIGRGYRVAAIKRRKTPRSSIYLIQVIEPSGPGPIKIGLTSDVKIRLGNIAQSCPYPVRLLGSSPGIGVTERSLHRRFEHLHIRGEWFRPADELYALAREWGWEGSV